jgi:hypothetical protein
MSIQAMKQALEALTEHGAPYLRHGVDWDNAITVLRAAIAEQEKCEPVGLFYSNGKSIWYQAHPPYQSGAIPLYAAPQDVDTLLEKIDVLQQNLEMTTAAYVTHPAPVPVGMVLVKASSLLACRDALLDKDAGEAYHQLYWSVDWNDPYNPWLEWEAATPKGEMK